ncbi:PAS domain-containing protein [Hydrogenophaga pseudoflava]|uniref:PAS domain-containing protein n=1 Tax=Hydrogenophaga pseudoflava TaxID=47421 RepID=UPI0008245DD7|nr:PAS domain-containing protein [Hydrogenophaga pseudoflava]
MPALRHGLLGMSGRRLVPLLIFLVALLAIGIRYQHQMGRMTAEVEAIEAQRLRDRLGIDQNRLDVRMGMSDPLMLRRIVGALGLHDGMDHAYLVSPQNVVLASLSRADIGRTLDEALAQVDERERLRALFNGPVRTGIDISVVREASLLTGWVTLLDGHRLGVLVDISVPLAQRRQQAQRELAVEALAALGVATLLALLLHLIWFRRAQKLVTALEHMGAGDLSARAGLTGEDELALIGRATDHMAGQLETDRAVALHLSELVNRSPLVVIEWRLAPGWPVHYVNDNIRQWGYDPHALVAGGVPFVSLLHPDDAGWVGAEVDRFLEHGPDEYHQEYRILRADGATAWVHDHTRHERNELGQVVRISGILLDISAQKEAQQAQREQAELLRMFYELPFLGMAISSPTDKRWLQVNDQLCEILGYPREELLRKNWAEMTPPGDLERNVALFDELIAGQRSGYRMSKRFVRKDGRMVHAEIDVRAVRDERGQVRQLFATIQDVTERHRYEQTLQQMQDQMLKAQRIGNMGSWTMDLRRRTFVASPQALVIYGTDPAHPEMTLEEADALVVPEDRALVREAVRRGASTGEPSDLRCRVLNPVRGVRHLHVRAEFEPEDGQFVRCVGMVVDETDLVEAQRDRDRLVSVLEATPDIVSMANPRGEVFYYNRAGYEVLGLPEDAPLADAIGRVHPEWAVRIVKEQGIPVAIAQGRWLGETAVYGADGREIPMSQMILSHHGADGQLMYLSTILRDISERKVAEAALREQGRVLAEAQELSRMGNWRIDLPSRQVSWSRGLFPLLGFDPDADQASMENFMASMHPDDRPRMQQTMREHLAGKDGDTRVVDHRVVTPAGVRYLETRARLSCDGQGKPMRLFGTTMDVTERVLASQVVTDLKDMLEQAETVSLLGSWAGDAETQRLNVSAQLFRNLGLEPAARPPTDAQYLDRIHPDDRPMVMDDMRTIRAGGPPKDFVFRTNPAHGPVRWMRRTARRIDRSAEKLQPRYIGTLLDITESVHAEEQLRHINQALEQRVAERTAQLSQANQELEAFSYTVSHDLKAPLRGIDGYSQLLVEEYGDKLDEEGRHFVRRIRHGVQQMGALISDLLEYSRMERRDMAAGPVAIRPLVESILESFHADIERQGAQVWTGLEDFTLALDREGISVVLRNLIGNALKFSRDSSPPVVEIGSCLKNGCRVLWVRDNGVGFDMKYHDRMFGIFQRLHRAEEFPGTGVGLALVAKAVQRMGGRVWAESAPGAGATFYLEFPL